MAKISLDELQKLSVVRDFYTVRGARKQGKKTERIRGLGGTHAERVSLLQGDIVKKTYPNDKKSREMFKREIKFLKHLKDCDFVTKLINYDKKTLTMYITYCGVNPENTPENAQKLVEALKTLHKKYGVVRIENGKKVYNISFSNAGIIDGKIYLFDIASDKWHVLFE